MAIFYTNIIYTPTNYMIFSNIVSVDSIGGVYTLGRGKSDDRKFISNINQNS